LKHVLFYRHFTHFTGGHLKVWDYFNHVRHSGTHRAHIRFTPESRWDESNPWWSLRDELDSWRSITPDVLFLEGTDWDVIDAGARACCPYPVLNLIQGVRHADPAHRRYAYLEHKAVRICVSEEVKQAILATERVRGPVFTIPIGLDLPELSSPRAPRHDVVIAGLKNRDMAEPLRERILALMAGKDSGLGAGQHIGHETPRIEVLTGRLPRETFLEQLQYARVAVFLPQASEGFFLPALEAMALGTLVVCPDVVGNRSFCLAGQNCFRPDYTLQAIARATAEALMLAPEERAAMLATARETARRFGIERERAEFLGILERVHEIW
jgi:hypothetical protein